jgi:hypothetical protein
MEISGNRRRTQVVEEDTNLARPRAARAGEGGGPTLDQERELEQEERDFPRPDLLEQLLGLEDAPVDVFGWLEGSFTANPALRARQDNFGVNPNNLANTWTFQQFYLVAEKLVRPTDDLSFGFRLDNLFGNDWQNFHSLGLFDNAFKPNHFGWDPVQMYGEVHLPFLTRGGIDIKGGRFYALAGYEDGVAPGRPLLSTSYMFAYAHPFTQVGFMSNWHLTERINLYNGAVNGWDRWINETYKWGYSGGLTWESADERTNVAVTLDWGPNQFPRFLSPTINDIPNGTTRPPFLAGRRNLGYGANNRTLFTTTLVRKWTEDFTTIIEADQGFENNVPGLGPGGTNANASWYGLGGWLLYDLSDQLIGVYRAEWFRDVGGSRTDFNDALYEMTLGAIYKPRTWLWFRPEVRFDWASGRKPYDEGTSSHQLTFGFDVIVLF